MKKENIIPNICAITLLLLSIAETTVMAIYSSMKWYNIAIFEFVFLIGLAFARFAYQVAYASNAMHSYRFRAESDGLDDEPSEWGVFATKLSGYIIMLALAFFYMLYPH